VASPFSLPSKRRRRPLRPQLRLCLAAKPALQPRAALHEAEAGQTYANGVGQAGCLKRPGNGHARPPVQPCAANAPAALAAVRPTNAAKAALPGRCCGPVRGAAWPRLITTHAARCSLGVWTLPHISWLLDKVDRSLDASKRVFAPTGKRQYAGEFREARNRATRAVPLLPAHHAPPCLAGQPGRGLPRPGGPAQQGVVPSPAA